MGPLDWVADTSGFVPRRACGTWSPELVWLYAGSDVLIWLAYAAIPAALVFFARRRGVPFSGLFWLFAAFILACGTTHLVEAVIFQYPLYRLSAVVKTATAAVSWATVFALIAVAPRVTAALDTFHGADRPPAPDPVLESQGERARQFAVAAAGAGLMLALRVTLNPLLGDEYPFILSVLGVVAAGWYGGLWPGLVAIGIGLGGALVLYPGAGGDARGIAPQIGFGLFLFVGTACALLGEASRAARRTADANFVTLLMKQAELEAEVIRRERAEAELRDQAAALAAAERRTAETLAQLDTFVANAPLGLALLDTELRYVRISSHLADANRRPVQAHLGRAVTDVMPDVPPDVVDDFRRVLGTGDPVTNRLVVRPSDRPPEERPVWQSSYYPVRGPDGAVFGVGVVTRDITDQLRAERDLKASEARHRELADELKEADRRKDEFLSVLAHELRNPLAPIRNSLEILRLGAGNPAHVAKAREVLTRQVAQMVRLIDDLLDVSRVTRGKLRLVVEPLDLRAVVEAALEISRPNFDKAGVGLAVELPAEPVTLAGDRVRLAQVLSNVLNNAAKYTERGGSVTLTAGHDGSRATLRVRDTGIGIPPDVLPRVFELFTQVDRSLNRAQGGLGIGLALVKRFVEMHGGTVAAHSDGVGAGAEFVIDLPLAGPAAVGTPGASGSRA